MLAFGLLRRNNCVQWCNASRIIFHKSTSSKYKNTRFFQNSSLKQTSYKMEKKKNRLALEKSPYLLQHAENPVEWYSWSDEAFKKAQEEKKLIFLSVGYSTCHWCHVMEHESFENNEVAAIMNEHFINIKVDREERPDVDQLYMTFVQAASGSGGWPMSVFLTPDLKPIGGGTYYPPEDSYGRPGFKSVLLHMAKKWSHDSAEMLENSGKLIKILYETTTFDINVPLELLKPNPRSWVTCFSQLQRIYDDEWGGFGMAPKFPQPSILDFLLHISCKKKATESAESLIMALETLKKMAMGGIHDHIGQGFARYSTDEKWHVPHFEKMLYDQAQLASSYTTAYLITKNKLYSNIVHDILQYVSRDLSHKDGGFYSAEDADSLPNINSDKKKEGAFYTWTQQDIIKLLDKPLTNKSDVKLSDLFCWHFSVLPNGNVRPDSDPHGELLDQNVLIEFRSIENTAKKFNLTVETVENELKIAKKVLFEARNKRPRPHLDNKIITSWNGLMITAYARAATAFKCEEYKQKAIQCANFIKFHMWDESTNVLLRSCYVNELGEINNLEQPITGFLNDYAFLIRGLLDLYECTLQSEWLSWANNLQEQQDKLFWDKDKFGYFSSTDKDPSIILRFKSDHDGAEPCGNSISALNLQKLSIITDNPEYTKNLNLLFNSFTGRLSNNAGSLPTLVSALTLHSDSITSVYFTGNIDDPDIDPLLSITRENYIPGLTVALAEESSISTLAKGLAESQKGKVSAYVCKNNVCNLPVYTPEELKSLLSN
ncbi:spermatogenesis-associated protein 20 [Daktulosphaira vitifoliae]|uniref:spermatogenesis-associated protein 20 n=1 Tax=Daktulosphaira vitifoliae TaxID=58002 RepID=UPI0021AA45D5|nr:spermatogenesis-associated protein 20 [Daktulosphaira vitifoliae]